jgi:hypothetical protein
MKTKAFLWITIGMAAAAQAGGARADTLLTTRGEPVVETRHDVKVAVEDGLATLKVTRGFKNQGSQPDQVELEIELPEGAVATGLRIKGKSEWYDGELMEAEMAEVLYSRLTGMGPFRPKDPALLMWSDLGWLDLLVFPVNPGAENVVEYTLIVPLDYFDGLYSMAYPVDDFESDLAGVRIAVSSAPVPSGIFVNGAKVSSGAKVAAGSSPQDWDDASASGPHGLALCDESYDGIGPCMEPGRALVAVAAPKIDRADARYGVFDLGTGQSVVRLEIDAAKRIGHAPKKASVVFLVDASRSFGREGIEAALGFSAAFASQLPDASFEVVLFRRKAERLFGDFLPASGAAKRLADLVKPGSAPEPGNGSHLDRGLAEAVGLLAKRKGPARIIIITDTLMRSAYSNALSLQALGPLSKGSVVHLVELIPGKAGETPDAVRDDEHELAKVPLSRKGILVQVSGGEHEADYEDAVRSLVRPVRIDFFEIQWGSGEDETFDEYDYVPETLEEGEGLRYMFMAPEPGSKVTLKGRIWAEPFSLSVPADPEYGDTIVPALLFSDCLYEELERGEMLLAATAGRAVTPVTSYLAVEPGVRPSTEGLEEGLGGGAAGGGYGYGSAACMMGKVGQVDPTDYRALLQALLMDAAAPCFLGAAADLSANIFSETTYREVADAAAEADDDEIRACVEEAAWSIEPAGEFDARSRFQATITLP